MPVLNLKLAIEGDYHQNGAAVQKQVRSPPNRRASEAPSINQGSYWLKDKRKSMAIRLASGCQFDNNNLLKTSAYHRQDTLQLMNNSIPSPPIELDTTAEVKFCYGII